MDSIGREVRDGERASSKQTDSLIVPRQLELVDQSVRTVGWEGDVQGCLSVTLKASARVGTTCRGAHPARRIRP